MGKREPKVDILYHNIVGCLPGGPLGSCLVGVTGYTLTTRDQIKMEKGDVPTATSV